MSGSVHRIEFQESEERFRRIFEEGRGLAVVLPFPSYGLERSIVDVEGARTRPGNRMSFNDNPLPLNGLFVYDKM